MHEIRRGFLGNFPIRSLYVGVDTQFWFVEGNGGATFYIVFFSRLVVRTPNRTISYFWRGLW